MNNNSFKTPDEVYRTISADFTIQGISKTEAARRLSITPQGLYNLFASKKYLSMKQAEKFRRAFGYRINYLTMGEGSLYDTPEGINEGNETRLVRNDAQGAYQVIEDNQRGDIQLMLQWMHDMLQRQDNQEGLAVLAEISRFQQAKNIVKSSMKYYDGNDYETEFKDRLYTLESEIVNTIEKKIKAIKIKPPKAD